MAKRCCALAIALSAVSLLATGAGARRLVFSFTGDLRTDANFAGCGDGCTPGIADSDGDFAQWAAIAKDFHVSTSSGRQAVTFSYGGWTNGQGESIAQGGFEPYLSRAALYIC